LDLDQPKRIQTGFRSKLTRSGSDLDQIGLAKLKNQIRLDFS